MKPKKRDLVAEELSRRMSAMSQCLTSEQRSAAAKKAWKTKKARIAQELGVRQ